MTGVRPAVTADARLRPARHVRASYDRTRERHVLLAPETVVALNPTGAAILELCDGERTVAEIVEAMHERYTRTDDAAAEVTAFLERLAARRWVEVDGGRDG